MDQPESGVAAVNAAGGAQTVRRGGRERNRGVAGVHTDEGDLYAEGGDAQYFYVGDCKIKEGLLYATAEITHYAGTPSSVFGISSKFKIAISGTANREKFSLYGHLVESPQSTITVNFVRRAELPNPS